MEELAEIDRYRDHIFQDDESLSPPRALRPKGKQTYQLPRTNEIVLKRTEDSEDDSHEEKKSDDPLFVDEKKKSEYPLYQQDDVSSVGTHSVVKDSLMAKYYSRQQLLVSENFSPSEVASPPKIRKDFGSLSPHSDPADRQGSDVSLDRDVEAPPDTSPAESPKSSLNISHLEASSGKLAKMGDEEADFAPPIIVSSLAMGRFKIVGIDNDHDFDPEDMDNASVLSSVGAHSVVSDYKRQLQEKGQLCQSSATEKPSTPITSEVSIDSKEMDLQHHQKSQSCRPQNCSTTVKVFLAMGLVFCALTVILVLLYFLLFWEEDSDSNISSDGAESEDEDFWTAYLSRRPTF